MPRLILNAFPEIGRKRGESVTFTSSPFQRIGEAATVEIRKTDEVAAAVRRFGESIAAAHPGRSFGMSVAIARGDRKPRGYDAEHARGGFRLKRWAKIFEAHEFDEAQAALQA
ncbi:hypothetical protein J2D73_10785 [Acetobacter sacchari]|uniref:Uncharacterized protein n=1 Tax=Acetobacter sacchari TaxID=2661687 RepID=A0ABS3LWH4_9PROT|nr:hypothetical protein [Acetobacter sacchari]MBO1360272.1 hypothetical protein [Acetobacter sacchari]